jgi:hypothetical protein
MVNTKAIVLLIAASIVVAAMVGIAFAQTNNANNNATKTTQGTGNYPHPQQGYSPYGSPQGTYSYRYGNGYGRGGCGCYGCGW